MTPKYKVGDKVWFIKTFDEIYNSDRQLKPPRKTLYPFQKKIVQVVFSKNKGFLYQVKGGHFPQSWAGTIVFDTFDKALHHIK